MSGVGVMSKKKAYASITIVLLIVIVITVGLSLVAVTGSDYNLAQKKAYWAERYYSSEAKLYEAVAMLNLKLKSMDEKLSDEQLQEIISEIEKDIDGELEAATADDLIELFFYENQSEGRMILSAGVEKSADGSLRIKYMRQEQEELEYDSFY